MEGKTKVIRYYPSKDLSKTYSYFYLEHYEDDEHNTSLHASMSGIPHHREPTSLTKLTTAKAKAKRLIAYKSERITWKRVEDWV